MRKLVSVVTGTWNRHDLLLECIKTVRNQSYRPLEHVIVSDGTDPELATLIRSSASGLIASDFSRGALTYGPPSDVPIRFVELGRNWSSFLTDSFSAVPFAVAQWVARGDYQVWLADDERWLSPDAIEVMVSALEAEGTDFVYPKVEMYRAETPEKRVIHGEPYPRLGTFTHCLYRADILDVPRGGFQTHVGRANDHEQAQRWIAAGKRWSFVNQVLLSHRIDK